MINKDYLTGKIKTVFGNKITDIEGWQDALSSTEMYVPHHVLEWKYTKEELKAMNRYDTVSPGELIWMLRSVHNSNPVLHKGFDEKIKNQIGKKLGKRNLEGRKNQSKGRRNKDGFTDKFIKHFGINTWDNYKLYAKEQRYYYRHNHKCRWEV